MRAVSRLSNCIPAKATCHLSVLQARILALNCTVGACNLGVLQGNPAHDPSGTTSLHPTFYSSAISQCGSSTCCPRYMTLGSPHLQTYLLVVVPPPSAASAPTFASCCAPLLFLLDDSRFKPSSLSAHANHTWLSTTAFGFAGSPPVPGAPNRFFS